MMQPIIIPPNRPFVIGTGVYIWKPVDGKPQLVQTDVLIPRKAKKIEKIIKDVNNKQH